jgi:pyridoxine 4-dehydrogenase
MLGALDDMRREGKLELIGLSNAARALVEEALELVPIASVQNQYSVLDRSNEDVLEACRERGLAFVPFFPLGSAFTGGPQKLAEDPAIARVAAKHGATPSQVALAWLLHHDEHILLIPGTSSVAHLEENLAAANVELDAEDMTALDDVQPARNPLEAVHD